MPPRQIQSSFLTEARLHPIEVQSSLGHQHVMPVFHWGSDFTWYTMPLASVVLRDAPLPLAPAVLLTMVKSCAAALEAANDHGRGHIHRDITPGNIMQIARSGEHIWVVADWGLVRRPLGQTTTARTTPGAPFGTDGFAAPEQWTDAHLVDHRAEIYSLGRVIAWALTGSCPAPNLPLLPNGAWRSVVRKATELNREHRYADWASFVADAEAAVAEPPVSPAQQAADAVAGAKAGDASAVRMLFQLASDSPESGSLLYEYLPQIPMNEVSKLFLAAPDLVASVVVNAGRGLNDDRWGRRHLDVMPPVIRWLFGSIRAASSRNDTGRMIDMLTAVLGSAAPMDRWAGRRAFREFAGGLRGLQATEVAAYLRMHPEVSAWLREEEWERVTLDHSISAALGL